MARAASDIKHRPATLAIPYEGVEQTAVKGLARELVEELRRIRIGDDFVAGLYFLRFHRGERPSPDAVDVPFLCLLDARRSNLAHHSGGPPRRVCRRRPADRRSVSGV